MGLVTFITFEFYHWNSINYYVLILLGMRSSQLLGEKFK